MSGYDGTSDREAMSRATGEQAKVDEGLTPDYACLPSVSLVICTLGRTAQLSRFLKSLDGQLVTGDQLIIVDQNADDRVNEVLASKGWVGLDCQHIRTSPGLSRARNAALPFIRGDVVAFPDDDCVYPQGLLEKVRHWFLENLGEGLCVAAATLDGSGQPWRFDKSEGPVTYKNVLRRGVSFGIFLRRAVVAQVGKFDESLGVGAGTAWGSGEETDYLVRAIRKGLSIWYLPTLEVRHPAPVETQPLGQLLRRGKLYGGGLGFVLAIHPFPFGTRVAAFCRPLGGAIISLTTLKLKRSLFHSSVLLGRTWGHINGWWKRICSVGVID